MKRRVLVITENEGALAPVIDALTPAFSMRVVGRPEAVRAAVADTDLMVVNVAEAHRHDAAFRTTHNAENAYVPVLLVTPAEHAAPAFAECVALPCPRERIVERVQALLGAFSQ